MRSPRLAELVADKLRSEILCGEVKDGDRLAPQEALLSRFDVGLPAVREALRVLEAEGLVTVHRGNIGGSTIHVPTAEQVAYTLAMVLQARKVGLGDVAETLYQIEPICAGMCSRLPDRQELVDQLAELNKGLRDSLDGPPGPYIKISRQFHELLVTSCGNQSMAITVGSLVSVWSAHEPAPDNPYPEVGLREDLIAVHEAITDAIEHGDAAGAMKLSAAHLKAAQAFHMLGEHRAFIDCAPLRPGRRPS
jgi:DNA-binding FadR family transcriptional regulator